MEPVEQHNDNQERFLDELRSPYHRGCFAEATHTGVARNPLCGDEIIWHLRINGDHVEAAWHEARGCAISQVSASLLCRHIEGRTKSELMQITPSQILESIQITLNPIRQRCALICLQAMQDAIGSRSRQGTA